MTDAERIAALEAAVAELREAVLMLASQLRHKR